MNIVQIIPSFVLGGAEIMCETLTCELMRQGHRVTVISMYDYHSPITERLEKAGADVRYLHKRQGLELSMVGKMKKIFREVNADAIHIHLHCAKYAVLAAMLAGIRSRIYTLHSVAEKESSAVDRKLNNILFRHCRCTPVALSELVRDTVVKEYQIEKDRVPVIFNGIDLMKCIPKEEYSTKGPFTILHIGRFSDEKNHIGMLQAFRIFHSIHSESRLQLIGDGETRPMAENYVQENGLQDCVEFLGLQSKVHGFLHKADLFTLTSKYEGIPMTLIEAMGTGLPIVATAVGGVPDMLTDGENALLTEVDPVQLADAYERFYINEKMRAEFGAAAKCRANVFSSVEMAKSYERLYICK